MWLSPFTILLRLHLDRVRVDARSQQLRTLLNTVAKESHILRSNAAMTPLDNLVFSLQNFKDWKACSRVFVFLDDCILRLVKKPVYYFDILTGLIAATEPDTNPRDCQVDLLLITIMEQWPSLVKSEDAPTVMFVSRWVSHYIEVMNRGNGYVEDLSLRGTTTRLVSHIRNQLKAELQDATCRAIFDKTSEDQPELERLNVLVAEKANTDERHMSGPTGSPIKPHSLPPEMLLPPGPPGEHEDHPGLHQWTRHEVQDTISEGQIKELILCLCSKHVEIRKQALTGVRAFMRKLEVS